MAITGLTAQPIYSRYSHANIGSVLLKILNGLNPHFIAGPPDEVQNTFWRIVNFASYVTSFVLFAAYSASLTSVLALQHRYMPVRDLQGRVCDGSYKLGVLQNTVFINTLAVGYKTAVTALLFFSLLGVMGQAGKSINGVN